MCTTEFCTLCFSFWGLTFHFSKRDLFRAKYNATVVPDEPTVHVVPAIHIPPRDVWSDILRFGTGNDWRNKVGPVDPLRFAHIAQTIDWQYTGTPKQNAYNRALIALEVLKHARTFENFVFEYGVRKDACAGYFDRFCDGVIDAYGHVLSIPSQEYFHVAELYLNAVRFALVRGLSTRIFALGSRSASKVSVCY